MGLASFGPPLLQAGASILGGIFGGGGPPKETKMQRQKRKLIDDLLGSLKGEGSFSDLFRSDDAAFQKSFVEPAQSRFRNQTAPQIQQQFIAGGQQRGTGLDDQLLRAGVDLDSLINENMLKFQEGAQNRQQNTIGAILGGGPGAAVQPTTGENIGAAASGFLSSSAFSNLATDIFNPKKQFQDTSQGPVQASTTSTAPVVPIRRKGFEMFDQQLGSPFFGG